ncbi:MAG: FAD-dependent oxidoreductase [Candidatus Methanomethylicaceae archaeon]|jgi:thioredoxin reductase (NADPH)
MAESYDVAVLGAGPAGLAAAIYASRAGVRTAVFEEAVVGGRATYAHTIDNYPGFPEGISGNELTSRLVKQAEKFGTIMRSGEMVIGLDLSGELKKITTHSGECLARSIVIATGLKQKRLNLPGEERLVGRGVSYCATCDGFFFRSKKVVVVGAGDDAASDLIYLASLAAKLIWLPNAAEITAEEGYLRALKEKGIVPILGRRASEVVGGERVRGLKVIDETGAEDIVESDGIFIAVGTVPTAEILKSAGIKTDERDYVVVNDEMKTNVAGVYAAGDCTGKSHQIIVAVGQGSTAGINASAFVKG